jgi:hypothetical protein
MSAISLELSPEAIGEIADAVAERVIHRVGGGAGTAENGWLNSNDAAAYLGLTKNALHKLTSARTIPFSQEKPGAACYFERAALDAYRYGFMCGRATA